MAASDRPILVGPWRGEVGFEALYWIPFLAYLQAAYGIASDRLIPITRGGAGAWYGTPQGVELYSLRTLQETRVANRLTRKRTGMLKQRDDQDAWDRAVLADAAAKFKYRHYWTIHPSDMYLAFEDFWNEQAGMDLVRQQMHIVKMPTPPLPDGVTLPENFLAVKFYARTTLAPTPLVTSYVTETVRLLASRQPVVVLETGVLADDHADYPLPEMPNVYRLKDLCPITPETSLSSLSAVLGRSQGFVGTYGGIAQVALRMGVGSLSVYDQWGGTCWAHKTLSEQIALAQRTSWITVRLMDLPFIQECCPRVTLGTPPPAILSTQKH